MRTEPLLRLLAGPLSLLLVSLACAGAGSVPEPEAAVPPEVPEVETPAEAAVDTGSAPSAPGAEPSEPGDGVAGLDPEDPPPRQPVPPGQRGRQRGDRAPGSSETPAPAPAPATPAPEDDDKKQAKRPPAPAPPGISQVNDTTWQVTQSLVNRWQDDPYKLGNARESGTGWELIGIRQRNAYHLGMRNFDIVLEVNSRKLNTMPQLLAAYLALKNDKSFDVLFLRNGKRMVHHYKIVN